MMPPDGGADVGVTVGRTRRVTMADAAQVLSISKEAVRKRVSRGTLRSDVGEDGRRYVYLPIGPDAGRDPGRAGNDHEHERAGRRDELVEELRDRVRALEEANRETRRLLAGALERIPAIEPTETPPAPETPAEEPERVEVPDRGAGREEATERRSSWWRRWFGL